MNLQQLNQSGQNLWVFIVTGVIALLVTGVSWICVEVITSYKGFPQSEDVSRRKFSLTNRLAMLLWLFKEGHKSWMWHSGAWFCILSNDKLGKFLARARIRPGYQSYRSRTQVAYDPPEKACNYVYRSLSEGFRANFDMATVLSQRELLLASQRA